MIIDVTTGDEDPIEVILTESRPSEVLAALHDSAAAGRDYLFAARDADPDDLILVAWSDQTAVGYIATTDLRADGMLIWEHLIVPSHRGSGLGRRLLFEAARRALPAATIEVDPLGDLDLERVADYYQQHGFHHDVSAERLTAVASDVVATIKRSRETKEAKATVADLLGRKAPGVTTVSPTATLQDAINLMNRQRIGAVVVTSDDVHVEGILSERDVLMALGEGRTDLLDRPVGELEKTDVVTCTTADSISGIMDTMTSLRIRHIPVTDHGQLVGIVSPGDVVRFRLDAIEEAAYFQQAGLVDGADPAVNRG